MELVPVWLKNRRVTAAVPLALLGLSCGPTAPTLVRDRIPLILERTWGLTDLEISPDGRWAIAAARDYNAKNGFRLFVIDLDRTLKTEVGPTRAAEAPCAIPNGRDLERHPKSSQKLAASPV
jgi:hypothetical protein